MNTMNAKRYKVWSRSPRTFATEAEATAHASRVWARTGAIVAITVMQRKPRRAAEGGR